MMARIGSTRSRASVGSLTGFVAMVLAMPATAATINVPADQPTLQIAVSVASPGDMIILANGTYTESANLNLMGTPGDLTIRAANPGSATVNGVMGSAIHANLLTGFSGNLTLQGLNLNQNAGNSGGVVNIVNLSGVLIIQDCTFTSFGGDAVNVDTFGATQTTVQIQNSSFSTSLDNRDAISVELFGSTNAVNLIATDNTFSGLQDDGVSYRTDIAAAGGEMQASITGNQFSGRTASGEDVELFFGNNASTNLVALATIENNTMTGPGVFSGISGEAIVVDVDGAATVATVDIIGNTISGYADDGIFVDSDSTAQGTTLDLVIDNNDLTNIEDSGILLRPFDGNLTNTTVWNLTVTNNTVTSPNMGGSSTNAGIEIDTDSTQDDYIANVILNGNVVLSASAHAYLFDQEYGSTVNLDQGISGSTDPATVIVHNLNSGTPITILGTVNVVVITPQPQVDIEVLTTESIDPVIVGSGPGNLVYVVTATNNGPDEATGVALNEVLTLPAGVTIDSILPSGTASFAGSVWTIGDLAATASETLTITLTAAPSTASGVDVIASSAAVTAVNEVDTNLGNDVSVASTSVARAVDLQILKAESIDPVSAGSGPGNLAYVITVANAGPSDASGITVIEALTLPAGVSVDSITPSVGSFADPTWAIGNLSAGASVTLTVVLTVSGSTAAGTDIISDTAVVASVNETDTNPANDAATESTSVDRLVDLAVTKTDSADPVIAGSGPGNLTYVVTVTNSGPSDASGITVIDTLTLPSGVAVDSITPSVGSFSDPTWTVGNLGAGASATLTVVLTVASSTLSGTDVVGDTATISTVNETDTNPANDAATESTSVDRLVDLAVTKTESADPVAAGSGPGNLTYVVTVTNNGPSHASGITIAEALTLPSGTSLDSATPSAGSFSDPTWTLGTLQAGASETLTVVLSVGAATAPGTDVVANTASVSAVNEADSDSGNNSATEATSVSAEADLAISKSDDQDPANAGTRLVYTIEVSNAGPSNALDVIVTDTLPAGVTLVSTSGCVEDPTGTPTCSLGTVAAGSTASFTVSVDIDPATRGTLINTASVTSTTVDPNPADDATSEDTTIEGLVDLILTKEAAPEPLPAGEDLIYTLTVTNDGPSEATNVVVTDTLPAAVTLISTSGCAEDPAGVPTCTLGTLAPGASSQFTITVSVDPGPPPTITNTAAATSTEPDANPSDNTDDATTTIDSEPPQVIGIDAIPATDGGSLEDCDEVLERVGGLLVTFSEAMYDPSGDTEPEDVTNPANYLVVGAGADGDFSTDMCGPVFGDDVAVDVRAVVYDTPTTTAQLQVDILPPSQIRVLACGSTTLVDIAGNPLDGTGNGVGGDDFVVTFRSDPGNELTNAHFDCGAVGLDGWTVSDPVEFTRSDEDFDGSSISGSVQVMQLGANTAFELSQCVPAFGGATYDFAGRLRMSTPSLLSFTRSCEFFAEPTCGTPGSGLAVNVSTDLVGDTGGAWIPIVGTLDTPVGTGSARCRVSFAAPLGQAFTANMDDLFFGAPLPIFIDGFESGNVSAWSASVP